MGELSVVKIDVPNDDDARPTVSSTFGSIFSSSVIVSNVALAAFSSLIKAAATSSSVNVCCML